MDWKLELVSIPVSDIDRAKAFYTDQAGFNADHDHTVSDEIRFVQLTPPGSACSIAIGKGITDAAPGSVGRACRWSSLTSRPPTTSWSSAARRSARSRNWRGAGSCSSPTQTATNGPSSNSCRAAEQRRIRSEGCAGPWPGRDGGFDQARAVQNDPAGGQARRIPVTRPPRRRARRRPGGPIRGRLRAGPSRW